MELILKLKIDTHGLTFSDEQSNIGVVDMGLQLIVGGQKTVIEYSAAQATGEVISAEGNGANLKIHTYVTSVEDMDAVVLQHRLVNTAPHPVRVERASTGLFAPSFKVLHGTGSWLGWDLRFCHTDNVRTERYPHCQMEYPYLRMLPVEKAKLGGGQDQAFPALYMQDSHGKHGIVFGAATQALNYTTFEIRKQAMVNESVFDHFEIIHDSGQSAGFEVPANGEINFDGIFIQLVGEVSAEDAFVDYLDFVSSTHSLRGPTTPLLNQAFHCTWNYGVFADQSEKSLLPTARFIAEHLPNIKFFLMDAGYLSDDSLTIFLDRFYPDANQFVTKEKWPRGIRGYTDELRELNLRPGIWWSPTVNIDSELARDHPDWLLKNADGEYYRIGESNGFLDYSHPEALAYFDRTLGVILGNWGMDATKMDFWSQNFEDRNVRLHDASVTAIQLRARFFETLRKHLPADGVLMTCVATGMGNPFIGQWADTYRNTIDIGIGHWDEQIHNCCWALPLLGFEGRKSFLLNNDSIGIMPEYSENENFFRLTWGFINMGMMETGGRVETWPQQYVDAMRKLTDRCDRGYRCRCADERAFTGVPLPEVLYVDFPPDSPTRERGITQSIALFNWTDEPRIISVHRKKLGHGGAVQAENFWTGERERFDEEFISKQLEPRSALLFDVLE